TRWGRDWSSDVCSSDLVDFRADPDAGGRLVPALAEAPDWCFADRILRPGAYRNPVVGRLVGRASLCRRSDCQIAGAAAAALSLRTLSPRAVGFHRLPGLLYAVDGGVLGGRSRPPSHAQAGSAGQRNLRQELHRSEPGIRAVSGGA